MITRRRGIRTMTALALLMVLSGCGVDVFGPSFHGSYDLVWANGRGVPAAVYSETSPAGLYTLEVTYGTLDLHRDGTFLLNVGMREADRGVVSRWTEVYAGDWERAGRDVYLYWTDPVTRREQTISGFIGDSHVDILVAGIVPGAAVQLGFER